MNNYVMSFLMIECLMLISSLALLFKINYNLGTQQSIIIFRKLVIVFSSYLIVDLVWGVYIFIGNYRSVVFINILTILDCICVGLIPYFWFLYVIEILEFKDKKIQILRTFCDVLIVLYITLFVSDLKTDFMFYISPSIELFWGKYTRLILISFATFFWGMATFLGVLKLITTTKKRLRRKSLMVLGVIIPIIIGAFTYFKFGSAICISPSIYTSIMLYFLSITDQMIYTDNLTGLYNRSKFISMIDENRISFSEKNSIALYYIDINKFKQINDNFGHFEGDRALRIIGSSFKNLDYKYNSTSIRMGGDEFIIIAHNNVENLDFTSIIENEIDNVQNNESLSYRITVSIGKVVCNDSTKTIKDYLLEADKKMYQKKKNSFLKTF